MMCAAQLFHSIMPGDETPDCAWMVVGCADVLDQVRARVAGTEWAIGPTSTITEAEATEVLMNRTVGEKHLIRHFNEFMLEA